MTSMARNDQPDGHLTPRQQHIRRFLQDTVAERGYSPTLREIGAATGLASASSVARQLSILEDKGYLQRAAGRPRTVVLSPADGSGLLAEPDAAAAAAPPAPAVRVRLAGRIAAGNPILAEPSEDEVYSLPAQLVGQGELVMLKVTGDSMMNAAILDGDWVVVRRNSDVENGDIVAAMIEGTESEATVKTFKRAEGHVWLLPHNPAYEPILGDQATILGKVVAVLRRV